MWYVNQLTARVVHKLNYPSNRLAMYEMMGQTGY